MPGVRWWTVLCAVAAALGLVAGAGFSAPSSQRRAATPRHGDAADTASPALVASRFGEHPRGARHGRHASVLAAGAAPAGWTVRSASVSVQGEQRYYLVARPALVTVASMPVLIVLDGREMRPAAMQRISGFLGVVGQAVVVYPAGFDESWNAGYCCGAAHLAGVDDVAFLEAVLHAVLGSEPGTSASEVYLAGFSNGGRMAYRMACTDPGAFAGIAAVEAVPVSTCQRTRPLRVVVVASSGDPLLTVPDDQKPKTIAGHVEVTVEEAVARWRRLDGCLPAGSVHRFGTMSLTDWSACEPGGGVDLALYQGGRHAWPRGGPGSPPAQQVIWSAFRGAPVSPAGPPAAAGARPAPQPAS